MKGAFYQVKIWIRVRIVFRRPDPDLGKIHPDPQPCCLFFRNLLNADYLCDALGWIDYLEEMEVSQTISFKKIYHTLDQYSYYTRLTERLRLVPS